LKQAITRPATPKSSTGSALIELMVATLLLGVVAAGLVGLVVVNNTQSERLVNKVSNISDVRQAVERIGRNIRMARSVGDLYGLYPYPTDKLVDNHGTGGATTDSSILKQNSVNTQALEDGTVTLSASTFPAPGDPSWGAGQVPSTGWPWPSLYPYSLSQQTLIVQVPVFDSSGYPVMWSGTAINLESVDTYVYQVIADPSNTGQYLLQVAGFPGYGSSMQTSSIPQTILRGIVGPVDSNGRISIFHYVSNANPSSLYTDVPDNVVSTISGIVLNLEVLRKTEGPQPSTIGFKTEFFMRNNTTATVIGS
jgi:type II secretory pathway pseudopilin PulG